jgi:aspartyl-tRNA(Asn)/glutamyl-tRNA(Gln) amidotransferase subunit A
LNKIEEQEPTVNAFITVDAEGAMRDAQASDERRKNGTLLSPLDGVPCAVKDNFCTKNLRTTCASRMLEDYLPPYDATVVTLLREAGCVILGKTNLDEFAMGSSTATSAFGVTRNPCDPARTAGGSSGGSAAAVAAGECPFAIGSDTGGSVRQPAAFCGVMGLKPSFGSISRYGMIAFSSSLDTVGLFCHTVEDLEILCRLLMKTDPRDTTMRTIPDLSSSQNGVRGLRILVAADPEGSAGDKATIRAAEILEKSGALVERGKNPSTSQGLMAYCVFSAVEAASNLARFDGIRCGIHGDATELATPFSEIAACRGRGFGAEVKRRVLFGGAMLTGENRARYYDWACRLREDIRQQFKRCFDRYDLILSPTAHSGAFRYDEAVSAFEMRRMDLCTVHANLAGIPALSVPCGTDAVGLPIGVQLMAAHCREDLIFRAAEVLERGACEE